MYADRGEEGMSQIEDDISNIHTLLWLITMQNREARLMRESSLPGSRGNEISDNDSAREELRELEKQILGQKADSKPTRRRYS